MMPSKAASPRETPSVSIGLPVYNGEKYLANAIESILHQTFSDFELIICDNQSIDQTGQICKDYSAQDARVRYYRNEQNYGVGKNFTKTFRLARGRYFKWACHDDMIAPTFLEKCVRVLDADEDVVLCHTLTRAVGGGESFVRSLEGADAATPAARFGAVINRPHWCMDIHGLMRAETLGRTGLMRSYFGSDKVVLAEMALLGRFARIPEALFLNRDHPDRSMRAVSFRQRLEFDAIGRDGCRILPTWALYGDFARVVGVHVRDRRQRALCYAQLLRWWFVNWHWARVGMDLVALLAPALSGVAFRRRQRYRDMLEAR
jgi:glycosyltransferase involved in cell wall biosynthesis